MRRQEAERLAASQGKVVIGYAIGTPTDRPRFKEWLMADKHLVEITMARHAREKDQGR